MCVRQRCEKRCERGEANVCASSVRSPALRRANATNYANGNIQASGAAVREVGERVIETAMRYGNNAYAQTSRVRGAYRARRTQKRQRSRARVALNAFRGTQFMHVGGKPRQARVQTDGRMPNNA